MRVWFLVLLVALAGCSKDKPAAAEDLLLETGVLRGVVLDTTITPIPGANVTLEGFNVTAVSNADGLFRFDDVPLGTYFLQADATGFSSAQVEAKVALDADPARIVLRPLTVVTPFVQPYEWNGILQCSYRIVIMGDNCPDADADVLYVIETMPSFAQSELSWESTQQLGDELSFQWTVPGTTVDYVEREGPSPLTLSIDAPEIKRHGIGDGLDLWLRVFTADLQATRPPGYWGVGLQVDQQFTVYTHVFYHTVPAEGWTFLDQGAP